MVVPPNYQVQDPVVADGYMDRFTVVSPFGTFEVTGHGALRQLLHEIGAIAALREIKTGKAFGEAVVALFGFLPYRPYAEGNLSRADGLSYDAHERILDEVSQWRERIRSHIVRHLSRVISMERSRNLFSI